MGKYKYKTIDVNDVPTMAELLENRQSLEGEVYPFLNNSCLNAEHITNMLENLFAHNTIKGIGAFIKDDLVGYLIGVIKNDSLRGRHVWVPYEGLAIRKDQSAELIRKLYAEISVVWLEQGCFMHYTIIPLGNQAYYDAYQRLSFSIQQVHGVMNIGDYKPFENTCNAEIRVANKMDSEMMGKMSRIIQSYQNSAPTFEPVFPEVVMSIKDSYKSIVEENDDTCFVAVKDGQELGFQKYYPIHSDLMTPEHAIELTIAGTYSSQMGRGVGKKLMNEGCRRMKEAGYENIITDWRITNLAASAFWPKCGFKPVAYRMVRFINSDIAWANFNNPSIGLL